MTSDTPPPDRTYFFNYPEGVSEAVHRAIPALRPAIETLMEAIKALFDHRYFRLDTDDWREFDAPASVIPILNQATNDFNDLLHDCVGGRGRSAVRTARTLFELLVSIRDVIASDDLDDRYYSYGFVRGVLFGRLTREADALPFPFDEELRARLMRGAELNRPIVDSLVERYGPDFVGRWYGRDYTIAARARERALGEDYEAFYAWASAGGHGTRAGLHGHARLLGREGPVYRLGPALAACPTALAHGLDYYDLIMVEVEALMGEEGEVAKDVREGLGVLRGLFFEYRDLLLAMDADLWPREFPLSTTAVYGIGPVGVGTWFLHDAERREIIKADPIQPLPEGFMVGIGRLRDAHEQMGIWEGAPFPFGMAPLVAVAVRDIEVRPKPGAEWQPEGWLLGRAPDGAQPHMDVLSTEIVSGTAEATLQSTVRAASASPVIRDLLRGRRYGLYWFQAPPRDGFSGDDDATGV